jgi:hypothetical protein
MVDAIVDTAIIVDLLRSYAPAVAWRTSQSNKILGATLVTKMEIISGVPNAVAMRYTAKFIEQFDTVDTQPIDLSWAYAQLLKFHLSHRIGILDCIIAAPCHRLNLMLYTRNLKHFTPLLGTLVQAPY